MKVLWLTNHIMPDMALMMGDVPSPRGGWMPSLADALKKRSEISLSVVTGVEGNEFRNETVNGVRYIAIPLQGKKKHMRELTPSLAHHYRKVIDDIGPDIIHIHGTEYYQGLLTARGYLNQPAVISIQGILDACRQHYFGGISTADLLKIRTLRDWIRLDGLVEQKLKWNRRARIEREIFTNNVAFLGRTNWDRAYTRKLSPDARYYVSEEMLREPFYEENWDIRSIERHTIFASGAGYPLKGFHVLVKAVALLRDEFPGIKVMSPLFTHYPALSGWKRAFKNQRVGGYVRYINELIRKKNLNSNFTAYPLLNPVEMAKSLCKAHVFVLPSVIENSPNSLCEAMLVGTPAVASYVGGIPSMMTDEESGLFFPRADEVLLAEQIRRVFLDDELAMSLSLNAKSVAQKRHDRRAVVDSLLDIYRQEIRLRHEDASSAAGG